MSAENNAHAAFSKLGSHFVRTDASTCRYCHSCADYTGLCDNFAAPNLPMNIPAEKLHTLNAIVEALKNEPNVVSVVLGGSYARGFARPDSDIDIGIYYREAAPLAIDGVRSIAEMISSPGSSPTVTELYGWGPWVNGGAWIQSPACEVDFVYRNLDQVQKVLDEARQGIWHHNYDQQPPYGFRSVIYFGETFICVPLHDPLGEIVRLKKSVAEYPAALKNRIVEESLWGAEFWWCDTVELTAGA
jgi:hypothetical protein